MRAAGSAQLDELRRHNTGLILKELVRGGQMARVELSERLGLSAGSVTKIVAVLIREGLVVAPVEMRSVGETGRPRSPLDLNPDGPVLVGAQIGLSRSMVVVTDLRARVLYQGRVRHEDTDPAKVIERTGRLIRTLLRKVPQRRALAVGASMPGWVDHDRGLLVENVALGWANVPVRDMLAAAVGLPVLFDSTANAVAMGELWLGAGREVSDILSVFVGTTVSASLVVDRKHVRGRDSGVGTLTHFPVPGARGERCGCGRRDCIQVTASNVAVVSEAKAKGLIPKSAPDSELFHRDALGEPAIQRLLDRRARLLASALSVLVDFVNPELVILSALSDQDVERVRTALASLRRGRPGPRVPLTAPTLGSDQVAVPSAVLALDALIQDPLRFEPALSTYRTRAPAPPAKSGRR